MNNRNLIFAIIGILALFLLALIISSTAVSNQNVEHETTEINDAFNKHYCLYAPTIPDTLYFCGEKVPIERQDIKEAFDRELLVNLYWQSNLLLYFKRAYRYFPVIEPILQKYDIPEDFKYLAVIESGLTNVVSPSKAVGYWQFLKETALSYGLEINTDVDMRYDIEKSTEAACKYLSKSKNNHGSWTAAAAAYNMGDGGYKKASTKQLTNNYWDLLLNAETARYVFRIVAIKTIMQNPQQYGIFLKLNDLYPPLSVEKINVDTTINNLVLFAQQHGITYKELKQLNPWLRSDKLENKNHLVYPIALPSKNNNNGKNKETKNDLLQKL